jgi:hypothetical protein
MIIKNLQKKGLVFVTIALFFGLSAIPAAGNIETENFAYAEDTSSVFQMSLNDDPYAILEGILGENDWYISSVWISFVYDPHQAAEIYYRIDGGNWVLYEYTFEVSDEGLHLLEWYWINDEGEQFWGSPGEFKIDKTAPTITIEKSWKPSNKNEITFEAVVSDVTSGVEKVEFYLDDVLQETFTSPPYTWVYNKPPGESPIIVATVYDFAGHSESDDEDTTSYDLSYNMFFLSRFLQRMQSMLMWSQNVLKLIFYLFSSIMIH